MIVAHPPLCLGRAPRCTRVRGAFAWRSLLCVGCLKGLPWFDAGPLHFLVVKLHHVVLQLIGFWHLDYLGGLGCDLQGFLPCRTDADGLGKLVLGSLGFLAPSLISLVLAVSASLLVVLGVPPLPYQPQWLWKSFYGGCLAWAAPLWGLLAF